MSFVGRDLELDRLEREVALALDLSAGRSVFVQGSAGVGKSALVAELLDRVVAARPGVTIGRGRCLQTFGSADPYLPFIAALRDLSDETTAGFVKRETLSEMIAELTPYWLSAIPMVGNLLSAGFATARKFGSGGASDSAPSRDALFIQYLELLQGLAEQAPLILFLDDVQWADQSSVALLNHISRGIERQPVLIIATLRQDEAERDKHPITGLIRELERENVGTTIPLGELEGDAFAGFLASELEGDVSEPLHRWIESTAGGNPLFASELIRLLKQNGGIRERLGEWHLTDSVSEHPVPRSAEAVLEGRIQALDADEVKILQYASVEGTEFNSIVLAAMLEQDELDLLEQLEKLDRTHHLVQTVGEVDLPDGEIATVLQFRHALLQTVLYRQVVGKRRVLLHRKAAESMETIHGDSTDQVAAKLAWHFHQGRVKEKAYQYARVAAESASRMYAHWEAEEMLRIAVQHSPGPDEALELREQLGDVYFVVGYHDQARATYLETLESDPPDPRVKMRLRRKVAFVDRRLGSVPAAILLKQMREMIAEASDFPEERGHLLLEIGFLPNAVGVLESAGEAVTIAESIGDSLLLAKALEQLAWALILGGRPSEGLVHLERAYQTGGGASEPRRTARYHNILGVANSKLGRYREALESFEHLLVTAEKLAEPNFIGVACSNMGCELLKLGEYERAESVLDRAFSIHRKRDRSYMVQSLFNLAKRAHWGGDPELALARYTEVLAIARELDYWTSEAAANAGRGLCLVELDRLAEARDAAAAAAAVIADRDGWFEDREFVEILFARLEAADGDAAAAAERLRLAAEALHDADRFALAQVQLERVEILRTFDVQTAREVLSDIVDVTARVPSGLDAHISRLKDQLLTGPSVPMSTP